VREENPQVRRAEPTGFPNPADDVYDGPVSLDRQLLTGPAVFVVRAARQFPGECISAGDELVVDRSLAPRDGCLAVAVRDGELVLRRLRLRPPRPEPPGAAGRAAPAGGAELWGVVTVIIRHV